MLRHSVSTTNVVLMCAGQAELGSWTDLSASAIMRAGRLNRLDRAVLLRCSSFLWL